MKKIYILAFLVTVICLVYLARKTRRSEKPLAQNLSKFLLAGSWLAFCSMFFVMGDYKVICNIGFAGFFVGTDWLLYYLFLFCIDICDYKKDWQLAHYMMRIILIVDSTALILNPAFNHMYSCYTKVVQGESFMHYHMHPLFYGHLFLVYSMIVFILMNLFYQMIHSPKMYRKKYGIMMGAIIMITGLDLCHVAFDAVLNYMIFGFTIGAVFFYYYAIVYIPAALLNDVLRSTVADMKEGLVICDNDRQCVYANPKAIEILELKEEGKYFFDALMAWCKERGLDYHQDFEYQWVKSMKTGDKKYLRINYQILRDERGLQFGFFLVVHDRTTETLALVKEHYKASYDSLTGVYNRPYFFEQVERAIKEGIIEKPIILCSDIKDFKLINELFGMDKANDILVMLAELLRANVKEPVVYGRLTSDKFVVCMPKARFDEKRIEDKIRKIDAQFTNNVYRMHIYVGIYEVADFNEAIATMVDKAKMAIAKIKGDYNKIISYYNEEILQKSIGEKAMVSEFEKALAEGQFKMFLQPQCDGNGKVLGAEALVRWQRQGNRMSAPGEFIPVFEKAGIIYQLDAFIWEEAAKTLQRWKQEGRSHLHISVNISVKDLYYMDIYEVLTQLIQKYDIEASKLKLEITETILATEFAESMNLIQRLHQQGFTIEIDDFGSGYSSLNTLKDIYADILKIDMGFLRETENKKRSKDILKMIFMLSKKLNMPVITEGVETEEQLQYLMEMGCEMFQGYYFSKPIPVTEFEEKYL